MCLQLQSSGQDRVSVQSIVGNLPKKMTFLLLLILVATSAVFGSPVPSRRNADNVRYDQRQEGEFNIRADLENFVILMIPMSTVVNAPSTPDTSSTNNPGLGLLDLFSKAVPVKMHLKHNKKQHHGLKNKEPAAENGNVEGSSSSDPAAETRHFIEAKSTAPYRVDISEARANLAKLRPDEVKNEVVIASSPTVSLIEKNEPKSEEPEDQPTVHRVARVLAINKRDDEEKKKESKTDAKKKYVKGEEVDASSMKLIGALEQCGPEMKRDERGICRKEKN